MFCFLVFSSRLNVLFVVNQSNFQDLSFCIIMNPRDLRLKHILILYIEKRSNTINPAVDSYELYTFLTLESTLE